MEIAVIISGLVLAGAWLTVPAAGPLKIQLVPSSGVEQGADMPEQDN